VLESIDDVLLSCNRPDTSQVTPFVFRTKTNPSPDPLPAGYCWFEAPRCRNSTDSLFLCGNP